MAEQSAEERMKKLITDMFVVILNRCDKNDPKVKDVLLRAIEEMPESDLIPA